MKLVELILVMLVGLAANVVASEAMGHGKAITAFLTVLVLAMVGALAKGRVNLRSDANALALPAMLGMSLGVAVAVTY